MAAQGRRPSPARNRESSPLHGKWGTPPVDLPFAYRLEESRRSVGNLNGRMTCFCDEPPVRRTSCFGDCRHPF